MLELSDGAIDDQLALYQRAFEVVPQRAEAFHGAAAACRKCGRYQLGYVLARHGLTLSQPASGLFLDKSVYDYRMLDEFQVAAYWSGHHRESLDAAATMLHDKRYPAAEHSRLVANLHFALERLEETEGIDLHAALAVIGAPVEQSGNGSDHR
jgi:hypothetical protein